MPGRLSYPVNAGTWYDYDYAVTGRGRYGGFFTHWSWARAHLGNRSATLVGPNIDALPDGTSNTALFAEVVHSPNVSGLGPTAKQRLMATGQELRFMSPAQARDLCLSKRNVLPTMIVTEGKPGSGWYSHAKRFGWGIYVGAYWTIDSPNQSGTVHGLLPPNSINCLGQYNGGPARDNARTDCLGSAVRAPGTKGG